MEVGEVGMRHTLSVDPAWPCEGTLLVFTHVEFSESLDDSILGNLFICWYILE